MRTAAALLRERHGVTTGCLKACESGSGARIKSAIPLSDELMLTRHAEDAYRYGDDYLLEAHVDFGCFRVAGREFIVAPSGHIRGGHVAEGLTVQLMDGYVWEGNVLVDRNTAESVGISLAAYDKMMDAMHNVRDAFYGSLAQVECYHSVLVIGSVDFALGRIGCRQVEADVVGVIDLNLSAHGAEYLRAFHDEVSAELPNAYVATRVFRPTARATLLETEQVLREVVPSGERARSVACVPQRWGMIAATGRDTVAAAETVLRLVEVLVERDLATP